MGYSPWGHRELDMSEWLSTTQHTHGTFTSFNPLVMILWVSIQLLIIVQLDHRERKN